MVSYWIEVIRVLRTFHLSSDIKDIILKKVRYSTFWYWDRFQCLLQFPMEIKVQKLEKIPAHWAGNDSWSIKGIELSKRSELYKKERVEYIFEYRKYRKPQLVDLRYHLYELPDRGGSVLCRYGSPILK